jgi:hypothetical protein
MSEEIENNKKVQLIKNLVSEFQKEQKFGIIVAEEDNGEIDVFFQGTPACFARFLLEMSKKDKHMADAISIIGSYVKKLQNKV